MFRNPYLVRRCAEVEDLLVEAQSWASGDYKLGANLAAYVTVLIVGVVEDCIEHLVAQRARKTKDSEIEHYVVQSLEQGFRNPDHGKISGLLKMFSEDYQRKFRQRIPHDGKEAIALQSVVGNKNALAHAGTSNLQLTIKEVDNYYRDIKPILEVLEDILA
jgi:hypothetical protein